MSVPKTSRWVVSMAWRELHGFRMEVEGYKRDWEWGIWRIRDSRQIRYGRAVSEKKAKLAARRAVSAALEGVKP